MHSVLNEGSFLDALGDIAGSVQKKREDNKTTYMYGSISKYTQKLILSFPTICDNTIPLSTAQMISKAHEKNLVSMFEMLFTSMSLSGTNGIEILQALHQNLNDKSSIDDIIDAIEKAVGESTIYTKTELRDIINEMCHYLKYEQKVLPVNSFSETSLNDYLVRESYSGIIVTEANKRQNNDNNTEKKYTEKEYQDAYDRGKKDEKASRDAAREERDKKDSESEELTAKEKRNKEADNKEYDRREAKKNAEYNRRQRKQNQRDDYVRKQDQERREKERNNDIAFKLAQSRVKDIDYKKANELQPTLMNVQYTVINPDGTRTNETKVFTAGIKSRLVGSDAMEIIERLSAVHDSKVTFKDLIRATTGEISLVKDFLLATKQAKINAKNAAKRGDTAKMWNMLASRAQKNKVSGSGMRSNDAAAISVLVINQETANYLQSQYSLNVESPKDASKIMNVFNLMGLVIADEANEVAKFLYDGNNSFEMVSYSSLSKDMRDDKNYNKTINLINKSGR